MSSKSVTVLLKKSEIPKNVLKECCGPSKIKNEKVKNVPKKRYIPGELEKSRSFYHRPL